MEQTEQTQSNTKRDDTKHNDTELSRTADGTGYGSELDAAERDRKGGYGALQQENTSYRMARSVQ